MYCLDSIVLNRHSKKISCQRSKQNYYFGISIRKPKIIILEELPFSDQKHEIFYKERRHEMKFIDITNRRASALRVSKFLAMNCVVLGLGFKLMIDMRDFLNMPKLGLLPLWLSYMLRFILR